MGLFLYSIFETITPIAGVEFFFLTLIGENPWWRLALIATLGNTVGAILVYFFLAHKSKFYGRFKTDEKKKNRTNELFDKYGYLAIYIVAMTPLPFFLILLAASLAKMDFKVYLISTINSRGLRFFITTYIMFQFSHFTTLQIVLLLTLLSVPIILIYFFIKKFLIPTINRIVLRRDIKKKARLENGSTQRRKENKSMIGNLGFAGIVINYIVGSLVSIFLFYIIFYLIFNNIIDLYTIIAILYLMILITSLVLTALYHDGRITNYKIVGIFNIFTSILSGIFILSDKRTVTKSTDTLDKNQKREE